MNFKLENAADVIARRRAAEDEIDALLGSLALIRIANVQKYGGPSPPTLYRAEKAGLIELVRNGQRTSLTRAALKAILLDGLGPVQFLYGQQAEKKQLTLACLHDSKRSALAKRVAASPEMKKAARRASSNG
jgi:hypothetical protein